MLVMANKLKVVDKFGAIKAMLNGEPVENFSVADAVAFLDERIAITEKKNATGGERKPTATQIANEGIKAIIADVLAIENKPLSIGDMQKSSAELAEMSNQKISALLTQLIKVGAVERTTVKGKAFFTLIR
jgi:hypothetical protein